MSAGDSLAYDRGMSFTIKDLDNDKSSGNCALNYKGEWRYNSCHFSNLNGLYPGEDKGDREGNPSYTPYSSGNSYRVIFRIGIKLPRALRGCFVEVSHD